MCEFLVVCLLIYIAMKLSEMDNNNNLPLRMGVGVILLNSKNQVFPKYEFKIHIQ